MIHQYRVIAVPIIGILLIVLGIDLSMPMFVTRSQLTRLDGHCDTAYVLVEPVSGTHERYGIASTSHSDRASLVFRLKSRDQEYRLSKNIGDHIYDEQYESWSNTILHANLTSVWVRKSDTSLSFPKVYEIDADRKTLLGLDQVRTEHWEVSVFLICMGISLFVLYVWGKKRMLARQSTRRSGP